MLRSGDRYVELTFKVTEEDGQYVSSCDEFDIASCGDTVDEAMENIIDAVNVYLQTLFEIGDLNRFLKEKAVIVKTYRVSKRTPPRREVRVLLDQWAQKSRVAVPR